MADQEERNYDEMTPDELDKELDKALEDESVPDEVEEPVDEVQEELQEEIEKEEPEEPNESQEPEEPSDVETFDKRFEGKSKEEVERAYFELQKKLGEQGNELGKLRKQLQELQQLKEKLETMKEVENVPQEIEPDEPFDPDKWQELLAVDPEQGAQYYYEKFVLPKQREMEQMREQERQQAEMARKQQELLQKQAEAFEKFASDNSIGLTQDELVKFANFLKDYAKPDPKKGFFDVEDLKQRYYWYNPKKLEASAAKKMLDTVEEQAPKVKTLGGVQNAKAKTSDPFKNVRDINEAEKLAEELPVEELDRLLDELD